MLINPTATCLVALTLLALSACSSDDSAPSETSQFNSDLDTPDTSGEPGGDATKIAGLWDGTVTEGQASDVIYWHIAENGVLTRYDYQQDGVESASGENCYLAGDPVTVTPEAGDVYSIGQATATAIRTDDTLAITFSEADSDDLDADGDKTEVLTFSWTILVTPVLDDLNVCN